MKGRIQVLFAVMLVSSTAAAADDAWLSPPPDGVAGGLVEIPRDAYAEVPVSAFDLAEAALEKLPLVQLVSSDTLKYKVERLPCDAPRRLYLVRALFGNPSTGTFWLYRLRRELVVTHLYLGKAVPLRRSALVACLDFDPVKTYVSVGGGM
ncbi:MAG TPA: hypothetical protein VFS24_04565 [Steroidobacteraceae bacterium]|nr:hypothetical protein [Steroidobacteraceae bacterium]